MHRVLTGGLLPWLSHKVCRCTLRLLQNCPVHRLSQKSVWFYFLSVLPASLSDNLPHPHKQQFPWKSKPLITAEARICFSYFSPFLSGCPVKNYIFLPPQPVCHLYVVLSYLIVCKWPNIKFHTVKSVIYGQKRIFCLYICLSERQISEDFTAF